MLTEFHDNVGHPGTRKTFSLITHKYFWPSLRKDISYHIKHCALCIAKRSEFRDSASLLPLPKGDKPFTFWSIDLITNLPESPQGFKHIMVCTCAFSKWVELIPLQTKSSSECAHGIFRDIICRYGKPITIRTDNGPEFKDTFETFLHFIGVNHSKTNTNRPRANG